MYHAEKLKKYANEWLQSRVDQGLLAWTIQTETKAMGKLYEMSPEDKDYFTPPKRRRQDITQSRGERVRDRHFSKMNNDELIRFCRGDRPAEKRTGEPEGERSAYTGADRNRDIQDQQHPGKREDVGQIVERLQNTPAEEKVWQFVHQSADIHSYGEDYVIAIVMAIYKAHTWSIEEIPYDRVNKGTGKRFQSEVYICRKDETGRKLDKASMLVYSKFLGHNRINVVDNNYLRGLLRGYVTISEFVKKR